MARPRSVSDEDILHAARAVFLAEGPAASIQTIASRLGVSHAALFGRFGTKEHLMIAALGPPERLPFPEGTAEGPDERPARAQLVEIARALAGFFDAYVPGIAVLNAAGVTPQRAYAHRSVPPPQAAQRALADWLRRADAQGKVRCQHPDAAAIAMIGALHGRAFLRSMAPSEAPGLDVEQLVEAFWSGLEPR